MTRIRIVSAALGVVAAGAVAGGFAAAGGPEPVRVSALKDRPLARLSPAVAASPSLADFGAEPEKARSVRAPAGRTGTWTLVPASDGLCLVAPDISACGTAKSVNAGEFFAFSAPNALPEQLSPSQLKDVRAGKPIQPIQGAGGSLAGSTVTGVVPDEVVEVALMDSSGQTLAKSSVVDNLYAASDVDVSAVSTVRLSHAEGSSTAVRLR